MRDISRNMNPITERIIVMYSSLKCCPKTKYTIRNAKKRNTMNIPNTLDFFPPFFPAYVPKKKLAKSKRERNALESIVLNEYILPVVVKRSLKLPMLISKETISKTPTPKKPTPKRKY